MLSNKYLSSVGILFVFFIAFLLVPFAQSNYMSMMPGDIGDARLNNYFLENIFQFFIGRSQSLLHLGFFSPFPYILGFSDNLFGSSPVYLFARFCTGQPDTTFQLWYLFGYFVNFLASYYALARLGNSRIASCVGALIFSFALPVSAHSGHAQLHYRFGVPLSIAMFIEFLDKKNWRYFVAAAAWLVWQFYCTIYIGFFTTLMLAGISSVYFLHTYRTKSETIRHAVIEFVTRWRDQTNTAKWKNLLTLFFLFSLLIILFYPYLRVTQLYGTSRSLGEIATMLPRPQSYFLSDASWLWSSQSKIFAGIPMRHEHQMFIGAVPMLLTFMGFFVGSKFKNGIAFPLLSTSLAGLIVLTIYMGGFSFWYLFAKLPLASSIRAMTRIDLVFLFTAAYLSAIAVDYLRCRSQYMAKMLIVILVPAMIFEFSATSALLSAKSEWRGRLTKFESTFPNQLPAEPVIFYAQDEGPFYATELDAMWVTIKHGVKTLNGYSGSYPPGFEVNYGNDCSELPRRVLSYLAFNGRRGDKEAYLNLMRRVVPIGFVGCDEGWMDSPPAISTTNREYSEDEIRNLSFQYIGKVQHNGQWVVEINISNFNELPISAASSIGKPIRLSWRFLDSSGVPKSGWETRKDLPLDIGPKNSLNMKIPIDPRMEVKGGALQISLVQEAVFWAHDIGLTPLTIPWGLVLTSPTNR